MAIAPECGGDDLLSERRNISTSAKLAVEVGNSNQVVDHEMQSISGSLRELRHIPTAPESFDQQYAGLEAALCDFNVVALVLQ